MPERIITATLYLAIALSAAWIFACVFFVVSAIIKGFPAVAVTGLQNALFGILAFSILSGLISIRRRLPAIDERFDSRA